MLLDSMNLCLERADPWKADTALRLPDDLTIWCSRHCLAGFCLDATQREARFAPGSQISGTSGRFRPQMLVALLSYCYARGFFCSTDVEQHAEDDDILRYLCADNLPDDVVLRRFRRTVHPTLQRTLARVCKLAWLAPGGPNTPEVGLGRTRADHQECDLTDGNDSPDFTAEAESRLRRAAEFDCMALDGQM